MSAAAEVAPVQVQQRGQAAWPALVGWRGCLFQILLRSSAALPPPGRSSSPSSASATRSSLSPPSRSRRWRLPSCSFTPSPSPPPTRRLRRSGGSRWCLTWMRLWFPLMKSSSLPATLRTQAVEAGLHCFDMECISSDKDAEGRQRISYVTVFERPGLHEFLRRTSEFADLVLFTAGLEGYAKPLVGDRFSQQIQLPPLSAIYCYYPLKWNTLPYIFSWTTR